MKKLLILLLLFATPCFASGIMMVPSPDAVIPISKDGNTQKIDSAGATVGKVTPTYNNNPLRIDTNGAIPLSSGVAKIGQVSLTDYEGNPLHFDKKIKAIVQITTEHHKAHSGDYHTFDYRHAILATNACVVIGLTTAFNLEPHIVFQVESDKSMIADLWQGKHKGGTVVVPRNFNRNFTDDASTAIYTGVTRASYVKQLKIIESYSSSTNQNKIGGSTKADLEWILNDSTATPYFIAITNTSGDTAKVLFTASWYEEDD